MVDPEARLITQLLLQQEDCEFTYLSWLKLLKKAAANRVLYPLVEGILASKNVPESPLLSVLLDIQKTGRRYREKLKRTIQTVVEALVEGGVDFLIIKTSKILPYVTFDVDILVHPSSVHRAYRLLKKAAFRTVDWSNAHHSSFHIRKAVFLNIATALRFDPMGRGKTRDDLGIDPPNDDYNFLAVDIYHNFTWQGAPLMDEEYVWRDPCWRRSRELSYPSPHLSADALLTMEQIVGERRYITLLDLLYLSEVARQIKWDEMSQQSKKYGWYDTFRSLVQLLSFLSRNIIQTDDNSFPSYETENMKFPSAILMPYFFDVHDVISIVYRRFKVTHVLPFYDILSYVFTKNFYYHSKGRKIPIVPIWCDLDRKFGHAKA